MPRRTLILLASGTLAIALASGALSVMPAAAAQSPVISDCTRHLRLTQHYSLGQLEHALQTLPPDIAQYTDCADVIRSQLFAQLSAGRHARHLRSSGGGSGFPVWVVAIIVLVLAGGAGSALAAARRGGRSRAPS
jgi:hypothetical protein